MADIRQKAVATAGTYNAGNIASLDEATTRRLIASTVLSESRGGDADAVDRLGFVGRYKAGAAFLAAAGYLDQDKLDRAMSGHRSEWAWAKAGGMAEFLQDASNWTQGLSLEAYKASFAKKSDVMVIDPSSSEFFKTFRGGSVPAGATPSKK